MIMYFTSENVTCAKEKMSLEFQSLFSFHFVYCCMASYAHIDMQQERRKGYFHKHDCSRTTQKEVRKHIKWLDNVQSL